MSIYTCDACGKRIADEPVIVTPRFVSPDATWTDPPVYQHYHQECIPEKYRIRLKPL